MKTDVNPMERKLQPSNKILYFLWLSEKYKAKSYDFGMESVLLATLDLSFRVTRKISRQRQIGWFSYKVAYTS